MCEDGGLWLARRARSEQEPARVIMLDGCCWSSLAHVLLHQGIIVLAELRRSDRDNKANASSRLPRRGNVLRELAMTDHG
jgi:hypothetical protein